MHSQSHSAYFVRDLTHLFRILILKRKAPHPHFCRKGVVDSALCSKVTRTFVLRNRFEAGSRNEMRMKSVRVVTEMRSGICDDAKTVGRRWVYIRTLRKLLLSILFRDWKEGRPNLGFKWRFACIYVYFIVRGDIFLFPPFDYPALLSFLFRLLGYYRAPYQYKQLPPSVPASCAAKLGEESPSKRNEYFLY